MQLSQLPQRIAVIWASLAGPSYTHQVPDAPSTPGLASFQLGFPPPCFVSIGAGGIPPDGLDMNGILQQVTAWAQWQAAGGCILWDATFAASAAGGYPAGAVVQLNDGSRMQSLIDNNTDDPNPGTSANWTPFPAAVTRARVVSPSGAWVSRVSDYAIGVQNSAASSTTLPALFPGQEIWYEDLSGNFATNNLTIAPSGGTTIANLPGSFVCNVSRGSYGFRLYPNNKWSLRVCA